MSEYESMFTLFIPGEIRGMGRPRVASRGKYARVYTAPKDVESQQRVELAWREEGMPRLPDDCYWSVRVEASFTRPKGHFKKNGELSAEGLRKPYPGIKPDADNLLKMVTDPIVAAGGVPDDARMVNVRVTKRWSINDKPGTYVEFGMVNPE